MTRFVRIAIVLKPALIFILCLVGAASAQQAEKKPAESQQGQPQIRLNYLNVCTPSADDQAELKNALSKVEARPEFGRDFEASRGQATMQDSSDSRFVRLRRDLAAQSALMTAQYSMSVEPVNTVETLVLRMRDPKQFLEVSLEDRVTTGAASPSALLTTDTPVSRIRLERFGKSSIVLSRCANADQSAYEQLFRHASEIMAMYRKSLGLGGALRNDLAWLAASDQKKSALPAKSTPHRRK